MAERSLTFDLHALTARLDRSADRLLRTNLDLSYRRFLALVLVGEDAPTQRALADRLGVTEPSTSRMVGVLREAGLLEVAPDPGGGNRRVLSLTTAGKDAVEAAAALLEGRFAALVERSGVPYDRYAEDTRRLVRALDAVAPEEAP
ncbi:MarR family winged helix-turn-helix transcriptional regulator [Aquipuribacter sp. SD81]|uniref:MarR family winged helix-turn-helix transcriptional regulator n=1 Tax=Aquipuribacter sp. SD81 TaxID=3127703 RepID=UPI00301B1191